MNADPDAIGAPRAANAAEERSRECRHLSRTQVERTRLTPRFTDYLVMRRESAGINRTPINSRPLARIPRVGVSPNRAYLIETTDAHRSVNNIKIVCRGIPRVSYKRNYWNKFA